MSIESDQTFGTRFPCSSFGLLGGCLFFISKTCTSLSSDIGLLNLQVQTNDNLTSIASVIYEGFTQLNWIAAASGVSNPSYIQVGQILHIPVNCTCGNPLVSTKYGFFATYVVKNVDTGSSIASKFNITESLLQQYNPGVNFLSSSILFVPAKGARIGPTQLNSESLSFSFTSHEKLQHGFLPSCVVK
jgi:chitin elicitor receptor kinase 1